MINWQDPTVLEGKLVQLVALEAAHKDALLHAAQDGQLWKLWYTSVPSEQTIDAYVSMALQQYQAKSSLPFVVIDKRNNAVIGSTRYCNIEEAHLRLEIGYTWYAKSVQRTGVNTECKYLLLNNAFDNYGAIAVEFRTHWHNHPSRNAILRLGAKLDGILRNHHIQDDGSFRDTAVYSIIRSEWPAVRSSLEYKMQKYVDSQF